MPEITLTQQSQMSLRIHTGEINRTDMF